VNTNHAKKTDAIRESLRDPLVPCVILVRVSREDHVGMVPVRAACTCACARAYRGENDAPPACLCVCVCSHARARARVSVREQGVRSFSLALSRSLACRSLSLSLSRSHVCVCVVQDTFCRSRSFLYFSPLTPVTMNVTQVARNLLNFGIGRLRLVDCQVPP